MLAPACTASYRMGARNLAQFKDGLTHQMLARHGHTFWACFKVKIVYAVDAGKMPAISKILNRIVVADRAWFNNKVKRRCFNFFNKLDNCRR